MSKLQELADRLDAITKEIYQLINEQQPKAKFAINVRNVTEQFTEEQLEFLKVEDEGDYVVVRFNKYVPKMVFADVNNRIKGCGGTYVSAGKQSHFKVPK